MAQAELSLNPILAQAHGGGDGGGDGTDTVSAPRRGKAVMTTNWEDAVVIRPEASV